MNPLADFRHAVDVQIRWGDMDALGHVNNAAYLTYLEQARISYTSELKLWDGRSDQIGMIVARIVMDYRLPLTNADAITVYSRVSRIGTKSYDMEQIIVRQDAIAAAATFTLVAMDYATRQSVPIPDAWRAKWLAYEPGLAE
jgi:acyl-CoA thioester hydrolase